MIGLIAGMKVCSYQSLPLSSQQDESGDHPGKERDAQVDEDALGDGGDRDPGQVHRPEVVPDPGRHHLHEDVGVDRVEEHLEQRVEGDQSRRILGVAPCQVVPDDDHGDAACQPDQDQPDGVLGLVGRNASASPNISKGPITQFSSSEMPSTFVLRKTRGNSS